MAYCTQEDLLALIPLQELAQLTTEAGDTPDSEVVAEAIAQAEAEINAFVGRRYVLPLEPVPEQVKGLARDMALYHLYSRRSVIPAIRRQKYEAALELLKQVAAGEAILAGAGQLLPEMATPESDIQSAPRIFSRESQRDW